MLNIYITNDNIEQLYSVDESKNLLSILQDLGFSIKAYCGGNGCCCKCRVLVNNEIMLACKTYPLSEMRINLNIEPQLTQVFNDIEANNNSSICYDIEANNNSSVCYDIEANNNSSICYDIEVNNNSSVCVENTQTRFGASGKLDNNNSGKFFIAIDLGTTTIAIALLSAVGETIDVVNFLNPQSSFGADVISRIKAVTEGKLDKLNQVLINEINNKIDKIKSKNSIREIAKFFVSGNTTMLHILFNIDCSSIGYAPYKAQFLALQEKECRRLGLKENCNIVSLPNISSFVGSDITSGIYYLGAPNENKFNVLLDLGTNAEIAIWSFSHYVCTAAAAGPCFEGANISCGVSSVDGAINSFKMINNKCTFTTISGKDAVGICGTGLIDIISELRKSEIIEDSGALFDFDTYYITNDIFLSQKDIREFQLAKSAICSALETLMARLNISYEDIESFYIAGGFSSYINIENAINIGLIPSAMKDKCKVVANASLKGCIKYCNEQGDVSSLASKFSYLDLSSDSNFNNLFVENMIIDSK